MSACGIGPFQNARVCHYNASFEPLGASMRRREFVGWIGAAALGLARPGAAQTRTDLPVVGLLVPPKLDTRTANERISDVHKGLSDEGYIEGTNYSLVVRSSEGNPARVAEIAKELAALNPRVFVVSGFVQLEQRIGFEDLAQLDLELDAGHLQQLDCLLQLRRQRELLMQAEL